MDDLTRRTLLATTAAGGFLTAVTAAGAQTNEAVPQPQRSGEGGTDSGPRNLGRDRQNPDLLVPPSTDQGTLPNLRFSFADAHMRLTSGGWTRQVTKRELGISKDIAGVNMRLNAGGVRELHWHKEAEWAYMLYGSARITAIDPAGHNFVDDVGVGDLWYFPPVSRIRSRVLTPTAANSCWFSMTGISTRTTPSCSATGSSTRRRRCCPRISAPPAQPSRMSLTPANSISLPRRCRGRSTPTRWSGQPP
jgi:Cupin